MTVDRKYHVYLGGFPTSEHLSCTHGRVATSITMHDNTLNSTNCKTDHWSRQHVVPGHNRGVVGDSEVDIPAAAEKGNRVSSCGVAIYVENPRDVMYQDV